MIGNELWNHIQLVVSLSMMNELSKQTIIMDGLTIHDEFKDNWFFDDQWDQLRRIEFVMMLNVT